MLGYYSRLSAEVYDLDKPIGHSFGDIEYYIDRLSTVKGPILEPATGTGRLLIPLLEKGMNVDGFDLSEDMLEICRMNCKERGLHPNLFNGKMESFSRDVKYDAIIVPTGTFLLLHDREQSIAALTNFHQHLSNGGKLIVDIFLQQNISIGTSSTRTWNLDNGDVITLEDKTVEVDYINQYKISHNRYEKWRNGSLVQTELERFPLRWYGVDEFKMILESIGFNNIVISSGYEYGKYPDTLDEIITFEATAYHL
ncbi:class I SAM-dependent methyltransferase [Pseudalkalibacillus berkeleyi]|uniref:Class I SAM-dependent methyltransferase n=1 Tax=Pseudalkalibacillus berkeleyi TaxID=1069813 RepID=A0ABS9H215_9BACL|nr:class I SAM-dependent methyltransferase [Pseudalkalibacillus berkeleyi]MCF6137828.1 class I SAM-dependent methyltransferase [Pseudalkalibacillus berkeleyi]